MQKHVRYEYCINNKYYINILFIDITLHKRENNIKNFEKEEEKEMKRRKTVDNAYTVFLSKLSFKMLSAIFLIIHVYLIFAL